MFSHTIRIFFLKLRPFFFFEKFKFHSKIEGKVQKFLRYSTPPHTHGLSFITSPHQTSTLVPIDEPTLTHHYHPKSTVDIRVHSCCCTFYGLEQMHNEMYHHYGIIKNIFIGLKIFCAPPFHSPSSKSWLPLIFILSP